MAKRGDIKSEVWHQISTELFQLSDEHLSNLDEFIHVIEAYDPLDLVYGIS